MTSAEVLTLCHRRGVTLSGSDGRLRYAGPTAAWTPT